MRGLPWPAPSTSRSRTGSCRTRRSTPTTTCTRTATRSPSSCPREYEGVIKYVEVDGRTKLAIRDHISDYIPNPTFARVAVPGGRGHTTSPRAAAGFGDRPPAAREDDGDARHRRLLRPRAAARADEGHGHRPHAAVADAGQRRSRSGSPTTPTSRCAVIHALNEWMHEHWTLRVLRRHLRHADHQPRRRQRRGARGARVHPRARAPRSSSSGWRRCRPGRAASRSRCPSSTRSGSGCRSSTSSSACTPATRATSAT